MIYLTLTLEQLVLTPKAIACAIPNFGTFLAHNGLKCSVRQIFPPLEAVK